MSKVTSKVTSKNIKEIVNDLIIQDKENIQSIVNKFTPALQHVELNDNIPYVAYIISVGIEYIKINHKDQNPDFKAWVFVLLKKKFEDGELINSVDILPLIDEFFKYKEDNYDEYCSNTFAASDYDRDRGLYHEFLAHKKTDNN